MESIVGKNIKRILEVQGVKQRAVAARMGIKTKAFNNMLNGRKLITDSDIPAICEALSVTPNDLFER